MAEELHFSVDGVFTVLVVLNDAENVVDVKCDCDKWSENVKLPVSERSCEHISAVRAWMWADIKDVELENTLEREVV